MIRAEPKATNGLNNGDIDFLKQLLLNRSIEDGDEVCKSSKFYFLSEGFAEYNNGYTSITPKGLSEAKKVKLPKRVGI